MSTSSNQSTRGNEPRRLSVAKNDMSSILATGNNTPVMTEGEQDGEPRYRDEGWLHNLYVEKQKSAYEIAEVCGCSAKTIYRWLDKFGIETRGSKKGRSSDKRLADEQWLREEYVEQGKSTREIADIGLVPEVVRDD